MESLQNNSRWRFALTGKQVMQSSLVVFWATFLSVISVALMLTHWVPLPAPSPNQPVSAIVPEAGLQSASLGFGWSHDAESDTPSWRAYHFIYSQCPCSLRVMRHLANRLSLDDIAETIVYVGSEPPREETLLTENGYSIDVVSAQELFSQYGVQSSPLMMIVDPQGMIRYSGGYTSRKQGYAIQEPAIIEQVISGQAVDSLPVYGCAVSKSLKDLVDPLGLKP
ncbi:hypothetical protein SV7mr_00470 [Stieleria bergensis]|uniref:AhpC/TSA family protein n=1 Tax=Stieleria bergensis TaxID=2528025 RepID=A0A517SN62_9BACT|nr:hypothetical protein SV7mr_00470 [Planctomycetes bacterium SV_7m_r]